MSKELIRLTDCVVKYDDEVVLDRLNLYINDKEFLTLLGPSGCGKTTTLRIIGGFQKPTSGDVFFDGKRINDLPPHKRKVNTVFQKYALFTHMNIFENVAFGLRIQKRPEKEIEQRVEEALELVNLPGYGKRSVDSLSGGQQQRICIARALAVEPDVLLMDEATSALDPISTSKIEDLIADLKGRYTIVIVTHNMQQATRISDKCAFFLLGELIEFGDTTQLFSVPRDKRTEDYITGRFG